MPTMTTCFATSRRIEERVDVPGLDVQLKVESIIPRLRFTPCVSTNINRGGIGITTASITLRPLQKVKIRISYRDLALYARGIVGHTDSGDTAGHYGIIFIDVPHELDQLIENLIEPVESLEKIWDNNKR